MNKPFDYQLYELEKKISDYNEAIADMEYNRDFAIVQSLIRKHKFTKDDFFEDLEIKPVADFDFQLEEEFAGIIDQQIDAIIAKRDGAK